MNPWLIAGALASLIVATSFAGIKGYQMGKTACEAAHAAAALARDEERIAEETRIEELTRKLEAEANEDPVVVQRCLGPSRGMRLNAPDRG